MEFAVRNHRICRICLQDDLVLDWNLELFKNCGMTFKDCYYRYSYLEEIESDPYPQFVCEACSMDLQNFHLFMEKAIETQRLLEQGIEYVNENVEEESKYECIDEDIESEEETKFECANEDVKSEEELTPETTECIYIVENVGDSEWVEPLAGEMESKPWKLEKRRSGRRKRSNTHSLDSDSEEDLFEQIKKGKKLKKATAHQRRRNVATISNTLRESHNISAQKSPRNEPKKESVNRKTVQNTANAGDEETNAKAKKKIPVMCSYCSKVLHNAYYLKKHEQTHKEDRARELICSVCGLKTFNSVGLYNHMKIHQKNREKQFKCEFCDKAFFNRGACNVHRRIHLGLMVKCPKCPKEYFRQIDLDRHMLSHLPNPQPANPRSKLKYMVHCKVCDKQINSAKFNAHRAAHLNDPLMRCTLCEKDFFSRMSCTRHMRRVHKRAKDGYDDIVKHYEKYRPRLSHVLMEQQEEVLTG